MNTPELLNITVGGVARSYPLGVTYGEIAEDFKSDHDCDILLANRENHLMELYKRPERDCAVTFLTARDKAGMQAYERSVMFLMIKAFNDVVGRENIERLFVEFSVSRALFCSVRGSFTLDAALLAKVEARMRELVSADVPINKETLSTEDAIERFAAADMLDKTSLLRTRLSSRVNTYTLDGFRDYFYGCMAPSTRYLRVFALELFGEGFILRLPSERDPGTLAPFTPFIKVFNEQYAAASREREQGLGTVGVLNDAIAAGRATEVILSQEAIMEKRIGDIAEEIASRPEVRFVMIAGPSSSGKTTFSHRLSTQLRAIGKNPHPIATDNYFVDRAKTPRDENGQYDFECLGAMDVEQFNTDMTRLLRGERVELPRFNFKKGAREYAGDFMQLGPQDILVIEGIHCLNDAFTHTLPSASKYKIYISCLTALSIDGHNRIPTSDARLLRRIMRDARTRGHSAEATIRMWPSVRRGEHLNIFPFQDSADTVFNSAMIYETALLKPYIEPLLFNVPKESDGYLEARRLLKFLSYFLPIPPDDVPRTSLIREFIGGGIYLT